MPHSPHPTTREFGDLVALDTPTLADCEGNIKLFLDVMDVASKLGLNLELSSNHPAVVWETIVQE